MNAKLFSEDNERSKELDEAIDNIKNTLDKEKEKNPDKADEIEALRKHL